MELTPSSPPLLPSSPPLLPQSLLNCMQPSAAEAVKKWMRKAPEGGECSASAYVCMYVCMYVCVCVKGVSVFTAPSRT